MQGLLKDGGDHEALTIAHLLARAKVKFGKLANFVFVIFICLQNELLLILSFVHSFVFSTWEVSFCCDYHKVVLEAVWLNFVKYCV